MDPHPEAPYGRSACYRPCQGPNGGHDSCFEYGIGIEAATKYIAAHAIASVLRSSLASVPRNAQSYFRGIWQVCRPELWRDRRAAGLGTPERLSHHDAIYQARTIWAGMLNPRPT